MSLTLGKSDRGAVPPRLQAVMAAARHCGMEVDPGDCGLSAGGEGPSAATIAEWVQASGLWAQAVRLRWRDLMRLGRSGAVVLLLKDGGSALLTGAGAEGTVVFLEDPCRTEGRVAVDQLRLERLWAGEAVLIRAGRGQDDTAPVFTFGWLANLVLQEKGVLKDIALASLTLSFLTIFPPLLVMTVVDRVLTHHAWSTLALLAAILATITIFETLLGHARRLIVLVVGIRLDTKLNLYVFNRLLRLPLDYFERHPAGEVMHKIAEIYRIREFLTGKLLATFLDLMTLAVLLPFLFVLNALLASLVVAGSVMIMLVIIIFLHPLRRIFARLVVAEANKTSALGETIFGIKTVKSLAIEPQRKALWDSSAAEAATERFALGRLANWPQTITNPIERFMSTGVVLLGAYFALSDNSGYAAGSLFAFMMLGMRVAQPLVGLARLIENYEEVGAAIGEAASVLTRPLETEARSGGLRPSLAGSIALEDLTFLYAGSKTPALDRVTFAIPAGTMLGVVGRSGSGKSTLVRLLQGINRDYGGFLKIDGYELRDINSRHLRRSLGVVLQENFLFRGSIRDNIVAGRPGLLLEDVVRAARLAGAEEFIERMPNGYDSLIEEGSPNLSGGQRQRLAIARALISDPRILILDEATSALDPESEALLNANLLRIAEGRTMVIVSHRLSSLVKCDQILVLDKGRAAALGSHGELLEDCPIYGQLWAQQHRHLVGVGRASRPPPQSGGYA